MIFLDYPSKNLIRIILDRNIFEFDKKYYLQVSGVNFVLRSVQEDVEIIIVEGRIVDVLNVIGFARGHVTKTEGVP